MVNTEQNWIILVMCMDIKRWQIVDSEFCLMPRVKPTCCMKVHGVRSGLASKQI